jgi:hypothetical protein
MADHQDGQGYLAGCSPTHPLDELRWPSRRRIAPNISNASECRSLYFPHWTGHTMKGLTLKPPWVMPSFRRTIHAKDVGSWANVVDDQ